MFKYADFGIAVGAAAAKAEDFFINKGMYTAGEAAKYSDLPDVEIHLEFHLA